MAKLLMLFFTLVLTINAYALASEKTAASNSIKWDQFSKITEDQIKNDYKNGLSYVLSGSMALVGGIVGEKIAVDSLEKGVYTIIQTIGIASIGYGAYTWKIGSNERNLFQILNSTSLTQEQKSQVIKSYYIQKRITDENERFIKAVTHALIATLNFYSASSQSNSSVKSGLNFIGGVNLLAALSFSIEF